MQTKKLVWYIIWAISEQYKLLGILHNLALIWKRLMHLNRQWFIMRADREIWDY